MRLYHGSPVRLEVLAPGTFVAKRKKDAYKFGYRRAVLSGLPFVFIHEVEIVREKLRADPNRNGSFALLKTAVVVKVTSCKTFEVPYKLGKFTFSEPSSTSGE